MYTDHVGPIRMDDDPVKVYLREVCAIPALTGDEEIELSQHLLAHDQQAESAGQRLIAGNLVRVVSIAEGYRDTDVYVLDLIQKGNDGLLLALQTFAGNSTISFASHAATCITDAITKAIADSRLARE